MKHHMRGAQNKQPLQSFKKKLQDNEELRDQRNAQYIRLLGRGVKISWVGRWRHMQQGRGGSHRRTRSHTLDWDIPRE